jgi:isoquinoline 1-oxidoreductase beta subunit
MAGTRRQFFQTAGSAGALVLATWLPLGRAGAVEMPPPGPNVFVRIAPDDTVTVMVKHLEMGQGIATGLATIVAEELDADWGQMRYAFAPANSALYNNLFFGPLQGTGSSNSIANSWAQLRKAGATLRAMLVAAAAADWQVPAAEVRVEAGRVIHAPSGRARRFGELAEAASRQAPPAEVALKDPARFTLVGRRLPRLDVPDKLTGKATYSIDVRRPGQLTAVVARPPRFGARVRGFDPADAQAVRGVVAVLQIPTGVAVVAQDSWAAMKGREALRVEWDLAGAENRSSEAIMAGFKALALTPGLVAAERGDTDRGFAAAARTVEGEFEFPYLAHAPMEPMGAVIEPTGEGVAVWAGSQSQTIDQAAAAAILGLRPEQVAINTVLAGGAFGRRSDPRADYVSEAAQVFKALGGQRAVHLLWTREDDMKGGLYRPMVYHKVRIGQAADGSLTAWDHVIVGKSITAGTVYASSTIRKGVDVTTVDGVPDHPYAVDNFRTRAHASTEGVPVLWWRAVSHTHTAHVVEVMIDELARAAGEDPVAYRLALLGDRHPEAAEVLRLAAERGGWGRPLGPGRGRGAALHHSHGSQVATVAEVTAGDDGAVRVDRVVVAVNCGLALNPDNIRAQFEGGVGFVLSSILRNRVTLVDGEVQEDNFDTYAPTRIDEMPKVEVHIVPSAADPTGVGEPAVTCVGPAVVNALAAATGRRVRTLPIAAA